MKTDESTGKNYLNVWSVAALGIGSMVGAGIFALLGQTAVIAGHEIYWAFILGGVVALLSGFTYARLGTRYPQSGGITDYYDKGFKNKWFAGGMSILYLMTLAVTIAMVSKTFGAYATKLFFPAQAHSPYIISGFTTFIIVALGVLNMMNAGIIGRAELGLVVFKLLILCVLASTGFTSLSPQVVEPMTHCNFSVLWGSIGLAFFAYAGYGMMANTAGNLKNPQKTLPRAIFLAIGVVIFLYVVLAFVLLKNVSPLELAENADTAIAIAAQPVLGKWGVIAVSVAALVATTSAINATLFSSLRIMSDLAKNKQLGDIFLKNFWKQGSHGFFWYIVATVLVANMFNLMAIANIASAIFLISYLSVYVAHWRLREETKTHGAWIILGGVLMLFVFVGFIGHLYQSQPKSLWMIGLFVLASLGAEYMILRKYTRTKNKAAATEK